jgi:anti-sigma regulatory factor (Ser/Thr protein kinase)
MLKHAVRAAAASGDADAVATAAEYAVPGDIDDDMAILVVKSSPSELASTERTFAAEPIMVSEARRLAAQTFGSWGMDPGQAELACLLVSEVVTNAVLHASATPSPGHEFDFDLEPLIVPAPAGGPAGPARSPGRTPAVAGKTAVPTQKTPGRRAPIQGGAAPAWPGAAPVSAPVSSQIGPSPPREFALRLRRGATSVWVEVFDPDLRLPRIRTAAETDEGGRGLYLVEQLATRWGSRPTPEGKAVWFEMPRNGGGGRL